MKYEFKCNCGEYKQIECSPEDISAQKVLCDKCGSLMHRNWKAGLIIPESFKTENIEEISWVKEKLKRRPTGREKILY